MFRSGWLLVLSVMASAVFLAARQFSQGNWPVTFKVLSILLLASLGFRRDVLLGGALAVSALGDFFLGINRMGGLGPERLFLLGLGSFLVAHLLYIALFRKFLTRGFPDAAGLRLGGVLLVLGCLATVLTMIYSSLGALRVPVIVYATVIAGMGICSLLARMPSPLAAIGALLFIASDSMIALGKFATPVPLSGPLIWITYYVAQLFLEQAFEKTRTVK